MKKIILLLIFASIFACKNDKHEPQKNKNTEIKFSKEGNIKITDSTGTEKAAFDLEFATTDYERETGLMYRKQMKDNQAMIFIFEDAQPRYFYMKNTYIPLDIIFISPDSTVVNIAKNAKVLDETVLPSKAPAQFVLEIKAGLSDKYGIKKGDKLKWQKL